MDPVTHGKLTKRFLMLLETGAYIVSTVYESQRDGAHDPCFHEKVAPPEHRGDQWLRIKTANADGRYCDVLASENDYPAYRKASPAPETR